MTTITQGHLHLATSALLSVAPFAALVIEDLQGKEQPELSLIVLFAVAAIASLHLWLRERSFRPIAILSKLLWTASFFIAGAFTIPIYWCLHLYLPSRVEDASDPRKFVVLTRESNPLRAHMLRELLIDAGIDLRVHGTEDAAGVGMGQFIVAQRFEVPESSLTEAQGLMESEAFSLEGSPELSEAEALIAPPADDTALPSPEGAHAQGGAGLTEFIIWLAFGVIALTLLDLI